MNLVRPKNGIDKLKKEIMEAAIGHFRYGGALEEAEGYELFKLTNWQYQLRVTQPAGGPRYFIIQVKEVM